MTLEMKKMKSRKVSLFTLLILGLFIISFLNIVNVKANEKNIINLILSEYAESSPPVFDMNDGYMYPGAEINKSFFLINTTQRKYTIKNVGLKDFKIKDINGKVLDINNDSDLKLIDAFYESIICSVSCDAIFNDKILYADDIKELIKGKILESDISILSGNEKKFNVVLSMKTSTGNNVQGLQANFNLIFNAISINDGTVVDPPIQTPDPPVQPPTNPITEPTRPTDPPIETPDGTVNPGTNINPSKVPDSVIIDSELVQTGSPIDTFTLLILGLVLVGTGIVISFKKKEQ